MKKSIFSGLMLFAAYVVLSFSTALIASEDSLLKDLLLKDAQKEYIKTLAEHLLLEDLLLKEAQKKYSESQSKDSRLHGQLGRPPLVVITLIGTRRIAIASGNKRRDL